MQSTVVSHSNRRSLLAVVTTLFWFSIYAYVPILSPYAESLGATYRMVGLIVGGYGLSQMLLRIPLGVISDAINRRKPFIIGGMAVSVISGLGLWNASTPWAAFFFRSLAGVTAAGWVMVTVLYCSYYEVHETPKAVGVINSVNAAGQVAAMLLCGVVAQAFGQTVPFLMAATAGLVGLVLSFGIVEQTGLPRTPMTVGDLSDIIRNGNLQAVSLLAVLSQLIVYATVFGFTPIHAANIGASDWQLGLLSTLSIVPMIIVPIFSGTFLVRLFGARITLVFGFVLAACASLAIPFTTTIVSLGVSVVFGGVARGIVFPLLMGLSIQGVADNRRATAMGYFQAVYGLGMFIGPVIVGAIADRFSLGWGFAFVALVGFASAAVAGLSRVSKDASDARRASRSS